MKIFCRRDNTRAGAERSGKIILYGETSGDFSHTLGGINAKKKMIRRKVFT